MHQFGEVLGGETWQGGLFLGLLLQAVGMGGLGIELP